jgi:hypothetical protein
MIADASNFGGTNLPSFMRSPPHSHFLRADSTQAAPLATSKLGPAEHLRDFGRTVVVTRAGAHLSLKFLDKLLNVNQTRRPNFFSAHRSFSPRFDLITLNAPSNLLFLASKGNVIRTDSLDNL